MTGGDWLVVTILTGILVLGIALDGLRRVEDREADRDRRASDHRRLMDEVRRQP